MVKINRKKKTTKKIKKDTIRKRDTRIKKPKIITLSDSEDEEKDKIEITEIIEDENSCKINGNEISNYNQILDEKKVSLSVRKKSRNAFNNKQNNGSYSTIKMKSKNKIDNLISPTKRNETGKLTQNKNRENVNHKNNYPQI